MRSITGLASLPWPRGLAAITLALTAFALSAGSAFADEGHGKEEEKKGEASPAPMAAGALMSAEAMAAPLAAATIELEVPDRLAVGEAAPLRVNLHGSGGIPQAEVVFLGLARFAGAESVVELGRATTDENGVAELAYVPRRDGEMAVTIQFPGSKQYSAAKVTRTLSIQPGPQLFQQTAGVRIPGIGVWLLMAVLGAVWSTYVAVMLILGRIAAKAPGSTPQSA